MTTLKKIWDWDFHIPFTNMYFRSWVVAIIVVGITLGILGVIKLLPLLIGFICGILLRYIIDTFFSS